MTEQQRQIERLCSNLVEVKQTENDAKMQRIEFEEEIASIIATKLEGTDSEEVGFYRVSVTSKLTRKLDYPAYQDIEASLPEGVRCVDLKPSINLKKLRALEMVDPHISAMFITTKPAKSAVKVEVTV